MQNLIGKVRKCQRYQPYCDKQGDIEHGGVRHEFLVKRLLGDFVILPISGLAYIIALLAIGVFQSELKSLPLSTIWIKIDKIFRRNKNALLDEILPNTKVFIDKRKRLCKKINNFDLNLPTIIPNRRFESHQKRLKLF